MGRQLTTTITTLQFIYLTAAVAEVEMITHYAYLQLITAAGNSILSHTVPY